MLPPLTLSQKWSLILTKIFSLHKLEIIISLIAVLIFSILYEIAVYHVGLISSDYYEILGKKDKNGFIRQTLQATGMIVGKFYFFLNLFKICFTKTFFFSFKQYHY